MSEDAQHLNAKVVNLLNQGEYVLVKEILDNALALVRQNENIDGYLYCEIAGCFITLGCESFDADAIHKGLHMLESNKEILSGYITEASIEYCIGNGRYGLYKIALINNTIQFPTPAVVKDYLGAAKASYFKAYKLSNIDELEESQLQLLNNLGNTLNSSGRIVEALQFFDTVLAHKPDFPQALGSKADSLEYMVRTTIGGRTISLYANIYLLYEQASQHLIAPEEIKSALKEGEIRNYKILQKEGVTLAEIQSERAKDEVEYHNHSPYRRFCIDNFLTLSEHALYCKCAAAKFDDLTIGLEGMLTSNKQLLRLELCSIE